MAIAIRRPGRFVDYYVEATAADITPATLHDPLAARALECMRHEVDLPEPLPPIPVYETRQQRRGRRWAFVVSVVGSAVLLDLLVRLVEGR